MTNTNNELPEGWSHPLYGTMREDTSGEVFITPTLPNWGNLPIDLIDAMHSAHSEASYMYGDEGNGYNPHLMLAYLLQSEEFQKHFVPAPPFPRTVWGIQRGTWPPEEYQSEEMARWHYDQHMKVPESEREYPVKLVKGVKYSVDWEVVS